MQIVFIFQNSEVSCKEVSVHSKFIKKIKCEAHKVMYIFRVNALQDENFNNMFISKNSAVVFVGIFLAVAIIYSMVPPFYF